MRSCGLAVNHPARLGIGSLVMSSPTALRKVAVILGVSGPRDKHRARPGITSRSGRSGNWCRNSVSVICAQARFVTDTVSSYQKSIRVDALSRPPLAFIGDPR